MPSDERDALEELMAAPPTEEELALVREHRAGRTRAAFAEFVTELNERADADAALLDRLAEAARVYVSRVPLVFAQERLHWFADAAFAAELGCVFGARQKADARRRTQLAYEALRRALEDA